MIYYIQIEVDLGTILSIEIAEAKPGDIYTVH